MLKIITKLLRNRIFTVPTYYPSDYLIIPLEIIHLHSEDIWQTPSVASNEETSPILEWTDIIYPLMWRRRKYLTPSINEDTPLLKMFTLISVIKKHSDKHRIWDVLHDRCSGLFKEVNVVKNTVRTERRKSVVDTLQT